jgi:uncharacterized membrane protein YdjX (TVP38/TMEM64 family)
MKKLLAFLNNLDARAWRTIWVSLALLGGVGLLIVLGKTGVIGLPEDLEPYFETLRDSPWALPATIAVFIVTSFLVIVPQFGLAAACVIAFGPWLGFGYAMVATIISSSMHFYIGRFGGAELVQRYGGNTVNRMSRFIGRNDFLASTIVRNVPVAPAIVVNMAFGASHAKFWRFIAGCALGSIPKILIVALLGQSVLSAMGGGVTIAVATVVLVVGFWITTVIFARKAVHEDDDKPAAGDGSDASKTGEDDEDDGKGGGDKGRSQGP